MDFQAIAEKFRQYAALCLAYADAFPECRLYFAQQAENWLKGARRVEQDAVSISECRKALRRADALLSTRPAPRRERTIRAGLLSQAMERVFDRRIDEQASPVPRSTSIH